MNKVKPQFGDLVAIWWNRSKTIGFHEAFVNGWTKIEIYFKKEDEIELILIDNQELRIELSHSIKILSKIDV